MAPFQEDRMSGTDWLVVVAGIAAIGWVNWYFFVASRRPATRPPPSSASRVSAPADE
jgi:hypothetical protein